MNRRDFLKIAGAAAGTFALGVLAEKFIGPASAELTGQVPLNPRTLRKYLDLLPQPLRINGTTGGTIIVTISEFQQQVLPSNFTAGPYGGKTLVWGYNGSFPGPTIEAKRGVPLTVQYVNNIPIPSMLQQYLWVDQTLHWADPLRQMGSRLPYSGPVPTVIHLHGGEVESASDGHPEAWWTPGLGITGPAFVKNTYTYHNGQEAATLWYHDHALGTTRLNVYAGLAGFYLLRDPPPGVLPEYGKEPYPPPYPPPNLALPGNPYDPPLALGPPPTPRPPSVPSPYEREVVIQDRMFDVKGQLYFPNVGINPAFHPYWIPEFFGDTIVVNGKVWPYLNVEPRRYRFRFLNGSNARFYNLSLDSRQPFWQIGTDGGYLDVPVKVSRLLLAPGERADVIVDFTGMAVGTLIHLINDAKAPFPKGAPADPKTVGQIMQFKVVPLTAADPTVDPATLPNLRPNNPIVRLAPTVTPPKAPDVRRLLTLNEVMGPAGPLEVLLNNTKWAGAVTEMPRVGSTEVWEIINLTADTHPIHLHLVQFQLLSRQPFNTSQYLKVYNAAFPGMAYIPEYGPPPGGNPDPTPYLQGKPVLPTGTNEYGWKDTLRVNPGEVTRIVVRFAPQDVLTSIPGSNQYLFDPTAEPGYVWHCHILEHEDNEMMRPYKVGSTPQPP